MRGVVLIVPLGTARTAGVSPQPELSRDEDGLSFADDLEACHAAAEALVRTLEAEREQVTGRREGVAAGVGMLSAMAAMGLHTGTASGEFAAPPVKEYRGLPPELDPR